jgi:hypothetical protein
MDTYLQVFNFVFLKNTPYRLGTVYLGIYGLDVYDQHSTPKKRN